MAATMAITKWHNRPKTADPVPCRKLSGPNRPLATPCHTREGFTPRKANWMVEAAPSRMAQDIPPSKIPGITLVIARVSDDGGRKSLRFGAQRADSACRPTLPGHSAFPGGSEASQPAHVSGQVTLMGEPDLECNLGDR